jgi:hypothetical protein
MHNRKSNGTNKFCTTDNIMAKRKGKKDKQLSTKHTLQSNIEQHNTLILSSLKYIRVSSNFANEPQIFSQIYDRCF